MEKQFNAQDVIRLHQDCKRLGITIWIDGGWGIDALLGEQTRIHEDIDIVIQEKEVHILVDFLRSTRYTDIVRDDAQAWNFVLGKNRREIDFHVVVFDEAGNGIYGPQENGDVYPHYAFESIGNVLGEGILCITPKYQLESHTGYTIREKDQQDVTNLCKEFHLGIPKEYRK